jgi:hypothetical protein
MSGTSSFALRDVGRLHDGGQGLPQRERLVGLAHQPIQLFRQQHTCMRV